MALTKYQQRRGRAGMWREITDEGVRIALEREFGSEHVLWALGQINRGREVEADKLTIRLSPTTKPAA